MLNKIILLFLEEIAKWIDVFRKVKNYGDKQHLQNNLDKLVKWSEKLQILFSFGKCK